MATLMTQRSAWDDRWSQPSLDQLLRPLKAQHRRLLELQMQYLSGLEGVEQSIMWYGPAWKWTIHYTLPKAPGNTPAGVNGSRKVERTTFCYLVPRLESPMLCVPLDETVIASLPLPRLSKFVRDGIKMAKCAVTIHWATWTPSNQVEVGLLNDLLKRRHKMAVHVDGEKAKTVAKPRTTAKSA